MCGKWLQNICQIDDKIKGWVLTCIKGTPNVQLKLIQSNFKCINDAQNTKFV